MNISPDPGTVSFVRVRPMHAGDIDRVMAIADSLTQAPHWTRSVYEAALDPNSIPQRVALVAENRRTGTVAGFAVVSLVAEQAELESIAVPENEQHHGIGALLLSWLIDRMKAIGAREFILEVRSSNQRAWQLYRRLGWVESGRRARYYTEPEEDAVLMQLELR